MAMPSCKIIQPTPDIKLKACELAQLLSASNIEQKETTDKQMQWYQYSHGQPCYDRFNSLLVDFKDEVCTEPKVNSEDVLMLNVLQIKRAVRDLASTVNEVKKAHPRPTLERLDFGWVQVRPGWCVFLLSCASENCKEPVLEIRADLKDESCEKKWDFGGGVFAMIPGSLYYRMEPAAIPYGSLLVPLSPL
jgi:hypothetical protein